MKNLVTILTVVVLLSYCENAALEDVPENLQGIWMAEPKKINVGKADEATVDFALHIYGTTCEQTIKTTYVNSEKEPTESESKSVYTCHYFNGSLWIKTSSTEANTIKSAYIEAKVTATEDTLEYNGVSYIKH
jgi:hypothetical protein